MGAVSRYWIFIKLNSLGKLENLEIPQVKYFILKNFSNLEALNNVSDAVIQEKLVNLYRQKKGNSGVISSGNHLAEQSLRCYISYQIASVCRQLDSRFGRNHEFTCYDLFPLVLNDYLDKDKSKFQRQSQLLSQSSYQSMATEILKSFDPAKSLLSTWTVRLVKQNVELNNFLLERGIYLVSDWAILNDTTLRQLRRVLTQFYGLTLDDIERSVLLLDNYHQVYRSQRLRNHQNRGKSKCQQPSDLQLREISHRMGNNGDLILPAHSILAQLQKLAESLRAYRIQARGGTINQLSLDNQQESGFNERLEPLIDKSNCQNPDSLDQQEFLESYFDYFNDSLQRAIAETTQFRVQQLQNRDPHQAERFLRALELYHCKEESMSKIARLVGLKAQYQVTRLLKLKNFREDIQHKMINDLQKYVFSIGTRYTDIDQLRKRAREIESAIFNAVAEEVDQGQATQINSVAPKSLFNQLVCDFLDNYNFST